MARSTDPGKAGGASETDIAAGGAGGVTWRSVFVGAVAAALIGIGAPYENLIVLGSPLSLDYSTPAAVFVFFLFVALAHPVLAWLRRSWRFDRAELVTVYIMAAVACSLPTNGLVSTWLSHITGGAYYSTPENDWVTRVLPYMPEWPRMVDERAVKWFYEGLPRGQALPWDVWLPTLLAWAPLLLSFFAVMSAAMVLVRRQWVHNERLAFPLVQVPVAMIGEGDKGGVLGPFFRNPAVWVGILLPVLLYSQRALHNYFPFIPEGMPISQYYYFWNGQFRLRLSISYAVLGFGYLLSTKLGFSIWFLGLMTSLEHAVLLHYGIAGTQRVAGSALGSSYLVFQGCGAMLALVAGIVWVARPHLAAIARKVWHGDDGVDDSDEMLSYRQAVLLLGSGGLVMAGWLWAAGMSWWLAPLFILVTVALMVGITRVVAEGGLAVTRPPIMPSDVMVGSLGSGALGPANIGSLGMTYPWAGEMRTTLMAAVIHGLKLADHYVRRHHRRLFAAVILAAVVAVCSSVATILSLAYRHGALNISGWFFGVGPASMPYDFVSYHLNNTQSFSGEFFGVAAMGAGVQALLMLASQRFFWFPIHPVAFPVSALWTTHHLMPSIFVAWLCKSVVLRYGGVPWYRKTRPFFLGLILGHYVAGGLWTLIDAFTGMNGNQLFYW